MDEWLKIINEIEKLSTFIHAEFPGELENDSRKETLIDVVIRLLSERK